MRLHQQLIDVNAQLEVFMNEARQELRFIKCGISELLRVVAASHGPSSEALVNVEDGRPDDASHDDPIFTSADDDFQTPCAFPTMYMKDQQGNADGITPVQNPDITRETEVGGYTGKEDIPNDDNGRQMMEVYDLPTGRDVDEFVQTSVVPYSSNTFVVPTKMKAVGMKEERGLEHRCLYKRSWQLRSPYTDPFKKNKKLGSDGKYSFNPYQDANNLCLEKYYDFIETDTQKMNVNLLNPISGSWFKDMEKKGKWMEDTIRTVQLMYICFSNQ